MLGPEDFSLEDSKEALEKKAMKASIEAVKKTAMGFLGKALGLYKRAMVEDASPVLAGRAIAYLAAFIKLAQDVGIDQSKYQKVVSDLEEKIGKLIVKVKGESGKTIIEHRRDPKGVEVDVLKAELRKKEIELLELKVVDERSGSGAGKAPEPPAESGEEERIKEVVEWLTKSALGYDKTDAERRARAAYRPEASVEELVAAACRM